MAVNIETAINNMYTLMNKGVTYSMYGSRTGSDGTADCSGAIYDSLRKGGATNAGWVLNTDSMHDWLVTNGFTMIAFNASWTMQRGDIIIFGYKGSSGGAAGHVVMATDGTNVIHCNYSANGVSVNNENTLPYSMGWYVYRPSSSGSSNTDTQTTVPEQPKLNKNGIAIDNVSYEQAKSIVPWIQENYSWTLERNQIRAELQPNKVYTLIVECNNFYKYEHSVQRLDSQLKGYFPTYTLDNRVIIDMKKPTCRIEARNLTKTQIDKILIPFRKYNCDVTLYDQTYGEPNSYGTWDVRVIGEGFNDVDAPIVLKQIQEYGNKLKIPTSHIKGFKY